MTTGRLTLGQTVRLIAAEFRGVRHRFAFFVLCIAIGVGAVMTIKSFSSLLDTGIRGESKGLLAADIAIQSSWEQSAKDMAFQKKTLPPGTDFIFIKELQAMARHRASGESASLLVELKAVPLEAPHYPLYGTFKSQPDRPLADLLAEGGAVVDPAFLVKTGLNLGDTFSLGKTEVQVRGTVTKEPDRISRAFSIGPRVFVSRGTLEAAGLIRPGSRVKHRTLVRLPENSIELEKALVLLERGLTDKAVNLRTYKDMESSITDSIERMGQYLGAVGVIALLMGGIGVAMIVRTFMAGKLDTLAILNCLGARPATLFKVYLTQSLVLGLAGSVLGVALGYGLQFLLPDKLDGLLTVAVEPGFHARAALESLLLGMATTLLFVLWPLAQAVKTRPLRLFRRNFEEEELSPGSRLERAAMALLIIAGLALMVFWQAGSVRRGAVFLGAIAASALVLRLASALMLRLLRSLPPSGSMTRRYGLANLHRPNSQAAAIITCLGMGIMLVLTVRLVQVDTVAMLKSNTEVRPPNYFFIDIQPDQAERFTRIVDETAPGAEHSLTPLVRSKLYSAGDRLASRWEFRNPREEEWFIRRDFVLTYMAGPPPKDNTVIRGAWWGEAEAATPQVSLEEDAARRLGLDIGSSLTMDIQGVRITAPVTSIRKVDWRNMRTNFYMIYSPGALEGAPLTFVATVHVPDERELELQNAVARALPNVTALSTRDIVDTVENVVGKLTTLVDFMSAFAIGAGLFILAGSVASTKFRRMKESAVLKVLGARPRVVASVLGVEYFSLGLVAGTTGILLSLALSWAVMTYLVKSPWHLHPAALGGTLVLTLVFTALTGTLASLDVLRNKPLKTLRELDT